MVMTQVTSYEDMPLEGGCSKNCGEIMECGHVSNQLVKLEIIINY
jgi:hypothetical protein